MFLVFIKSMTLFFYSFSRDLISAQVNNSSSLQWDYDVG